MSAETLTGRQSGPAFVLGVRLASQLKRQRNRLRRLLFPRPENSIRESCLPLAYPPRALTSRGAKFRHFGAGNAPARLGYERAR